MLLRPRLVEQHVKTNDQDKKEEDVTATLRRFTPAGFRILLSAALYLRGNRGSAPKAPAGVSNRVGSPPTQPGGLLWLMGRPSFAVVFATEARQQQGGAGPTGAFPPG